MTPLLNKVKAADSD